MKTKLTLRLIIILILIVITIQKSYCQIPITNGWHMQGNDAQRTSRSSVAGPTSAKVKWTYDLQSRLQDNACPIVGDDGTIYIPSERDFYAINPNGTVKWKKEYSMGNSWRMRNAPALSPDGSKIYILSTWLDTDTKVNAINSQTGEIEWTYLLGLGVNYSSFAVDKNGTIYIGTRSNTGIANATLQAINPNGTLKWRYISSSTCWIEAPPAIDESGNVYFVHNCIGLIALDSNGIFKWSRDIASGYGWPAPTIGPDGTIFLDDYNSVYAFNPDGTIKWQTFDFSYWGPFSSIAISTDGSVVYNVRSDGTVYALNASTGATVWSTTISGTTYFESPILSGNGIIYFVGNGETKSCVFAINSTDGYLIWKYDLNDWAQSPSLGPDGTLSVVTSGDLGLAGGTTPARLYTFYSNDPFITGITNGSGWCSGTVTLGATASAGTINWYASPTGGTPLGTGTSFTTPILSSTTTYYVDATDNGSTTATRTAITATIKTTPNIISGTASVIIGTENFINQSLPIDPWDTYSYSQTIFKSVTIGLSGKLNKLCYYYNGKSSRTDAIKIYMGHTSKNSFSSTADWIPISSLQLVYDGNISVDKIQGWFEIVFNNPFDYNGNDNLVIAVDDNYNSSHRFDDGFYCSLLDNDVKSIYCGSIISNIDPSSPPIGTLSSYSPNIKLFLTGTIDGSRCGSGSVNLASASSGTINWYDVETGGSSLGTGTNFITPNISSSTVYYVDATTNGCVSTDRTAITATINPMPVITGKTDGSRCGAGTIDLGATANEGTINWYSASTGGTSLGTGTSFTTPNLSSTKIYYVDATNSVCTTATRIAVTATINSTAITSTTDGSRCDTGTVDLGATASAGAINWYAASTGGSSLGTGTSFTTPGLTTTTVYYVDATNNACTTAIRTAVTATINVIPSITGTTDGSHCGTGSVTLGATASIGAINWYAASTGGNSLGTGTSFTTPSLTTTTVYYVDATNNGCTTATRTAVTATINSIPTITGTTDGSRCGTGTVTLGATASEGTINWYAASTGGNSPGTGTSFTTPSLTMTTVYYVDATDNGCTTATRTAITATINAIPTITASTDGSHCGTGTVTLGATANAGTINWYAASTGGSSLGTGTSFTTPSLTTTTVYYVDATNNGCTTATRTAVTAKINSIPTISGTTDGSRCGTGMVTLGATAIAVTINWYAASTGGSSLGTGTSFTTPSLTATTVYYVEATSNGCTTVARTALTATINTIPTITGTTDGSRCGTGTVALGATAGTGTINWYAALTDGSSLGTGTSFTTPSLTTTTVYYVDATNNGCTTATRTAVTAKDTCTTGVNSFLFSDKIKVYPNPTTGMVEISINEPIDSDYTIELFNDLGALKQKIIIDKNTKATQIDLSGYPAGLYLMRFNTKKGFFDYKILKE